jgi:Fe-S cluster assembly iron-binding protein IscA
MFEVSDQAIEMVREFLKESGEKGPIRMVFTTSECDQPAMGMALDASQEGDQVFDMGGISFVVDGQTCDMSAPIHIDLADTLAGTQFWISCSLAENTCLIAEAPDACKAYCMTCTCQNDDPLAGLSL